MKKIPAGSRFCRFFYQKNEEKTIISYIKITKK